MKKGLEISDVRTMLVFATKTTTEVKIYPSVQLLPLA